MFLRCEQGANTAQNGTGFKNVSCESAYGQLWELFLKWEEAVITSPSVAPCATEMIFVLEVHFDMLSPFPHFPSPHSGKQTWCSLCPVAKQTLCDPRDCSPPGSHVRGILQAGILEWVATSYSWVSSQPKDQTQLSCISCIGRQILYRWASGEALTSAFAVEGRKWGVVSQSLVKQGCPCHHPGRHSLCLLLVDVEGRLISLEWGVRRANLWQMERSPVEVSSEWLTGKLWPASSFFVGGQEKWCMITSSPFLEEKAAGFSNCTVWRLGKDQPHLHYSRFVFRLSKPWH